MSSIDTRLRKDNALRPVIPWWTVIFHLSCGSRVCYKLLLSLENVFRIRGNKSCRYLLGLAAVGDMAAACWSCWLFTMVTNQRLQIFLRPWSQARGKTFEVVLMPSNDSGFYSNNFDIKFKMKKYTFVWWYELLYHFVSANNLWPSPSGSSHKLWAATQRSSDLYHQTQYICVTTLRPGQNGCHFPDDIFKYIFLNDSV